MRAYYSSMLKFIILKQLQNYRVVVSKHTIRIDYGKANLTLRNVNKHLETLNLECIENGNIVQQCSTSWSERIASELKK